MRLSVRGRERTRQRQADPCYNETTSYKTTSRRGSRHADYERVHHGSAAFMITASMTRMSW